MRKKFEFGKIALYGNRKINAVEVEIELKKCGSEPTFHIVDGKKVYTGNKTPEYYEFTAQGEVWNMPHTDVYCGGQCLDTIKKYRNQLKNKELFDVIYDLWENYHLNGMNAGTPIQEKAVDEWLAEGNKYDYTEVCKMLKKKNLYEVNFTGKTVGKIYNNEPYRYGCGWVVNDLPADVIHKIEELLRN